MAYYLFSAVHRCQPCRVLVSLLDDKIPNWRNCVTYVDVDGTDIEQMKLARKLQVWRIPAFGDDEQLIPTPLGYMDIYKKVKELCIQE